jgi:hypothetical protein
MRQGRVISLGVEPAQHSATTALLMDGPHHGKRVPIERGQLLFSFEEESIEVDQSDARYQAIQRYRYSGMVQGEPEVAHFTWLPSVAGTP